MNNSAKKVFALVKYLFRSKTTFILIMCMIIFIMNWLTIMPFKSTANLDLSGLMNSMPKAYRSLFGDFNRINTPAGYLGVKNFSIIYPMIQGILGISLAAAFFGKNRSSGFNSYLLTKALSRTELFVAISAATVLIMVLVNAFNFLSIVFLSFIFDFKIDFTNLYWAFVGLDLMSFCFAAITGLVTNFSNREIGIGAGYYLFFQSYMANSLATISKDMEFFKYLSLFHYNNYEDLLFGTVSITNFAVIIAVLIAITLPSYLVFKRYNY